MKKIALFGCLAALLSFVGCEQSGNDYEGTNYIYLESEGGKTTIWESDVTPMTLEVMLTNSLAEDLTLDFVVEGTEGVVELQGNPVTIKAGEKTATFSIVSKNAGLVNGSANFTVTLDASTVLPKNVQLKKAFAFVVTSTASEALTAEQLAMIEAYKSASGVDLSKYIGMVNVSVEYTAYDFNQEVLLETETITGKTIIALSEASTAEAPALKMLANPMGIEDKLYATLRALTIENTNY